MNYAGVGGGCLAVVAGCEVARQLPETGAGDAIVYAVAAAGALVVWGFAYLKSHSGN